MLARVFQAGDDEAEVIGEPMLLSLGRYGRLAPPSSVSPCAFGGDLDRHGKHIRRRRIESWKLDMGDHSVVPIQAGEFLVAVVVDDDGSTMPCDLHGTRLVHPGIKGLGHARSAREDDVVVTDGADVFANDVIRADFFLDHLANGASSLKASHPSRRNAVELQKIMSGRKASKCVPHDATSEAFRPDIIFWSSTAF